MYKIVALSVLTFVAALILKSETGVKAEVDMVIAKLPVKEEPLSILNNVSGQRSEQVTKRKTLRNSVKRFPRTQNSVTDKAKIENAPNESQPEGPVKKWLIIKQRLINDPFDHKAIQEAVVLHQFQKQLRDPIFVFIEELSFYAPDWPLLQEAMGAMLMAEERWTEAGVLLEKSAPYSRRPSTIYYQLGYTALKGGNPDLAVKAFRDLEEISSRLRSGEIDTTLLDEKHVLEPTVTCFLAAIAEVKNNNRAGAESTLLACANRSTTVKAKAEILENIDQWMDEWEWQDIDTILD